MRRLVVCGTLLMSLNFVARCQAQIEPPIKYYFDVLEDPNALDYEYTEAMLVIGGEGPTAIPMIVERLKSKNVEVKLRLIEILGRLGDRAVPAMTELSGLLADESAFVRAAAARALGCMGRPASQMLLELLRAFDDDDVVTRGNAAIAVHRVDPTFFAYKINSLMLKMELDDFDVRFTRVNLLLLDARKHYANDDVRMKTVLQLWAIARFNGLLDYRMSMVFNPPVKAASIPVTPQPSAPPATAPEATEPEGGNPFDTDSPAPDDDVNSIFEN